MQLVNLSLKAANEFVVRLHRHHRPTQGMKFALGCEVDGRLCGVAIVGRPVARHLDDGKTAEVTRLCTDGTENACSFLYSRAKRAAQALGFERVITYTMPDEGGASLRGAGWALVGRRGGGSWKRKGRPRADAHPLGQKLLWECK